MSQKARALGAVNLGQGFPEDDGPRELREIAARAIMDGPNQYPPMRGLDALREAVAEHYGRFDGVRLDWRREVTITSGATEAIAAALLAVIEPGDEVILLEPMYDAYWPLVARAGATPRCVSLSPPDWRIPIAEIAAACTPRTRAILINTPNNPVGAVASTAELEALGELCASAQLTLIADEVWERITFAPARHVSVLSIPSLRERAIKIGSAGKMFGMTGWKVGFICAAPHLTALCTKAHQFLTFTTPPHLQTAVAAGLLWDETYFAGMRDDFAAARDFLAAGLADAGLVGLPCAGTYFMCVDLAASGVSVRDDAFALAAVERAGVAVIPLSAFHRAPAARQIVRLCFAKRRETLARGVDALARARALFV